MVLPLALPGKRWGGGGGWSVMLKACWDVMTAYVVFIETLRAFLDSAELCIIVYVLLKKPICSILLVFNSRKCELLHNSLKSILDNVIPLNVVPI